MCCCFCASGEIRKGVKRQDTEWENTLVTHVSSKNISKDMNEAKNPYRLMREIRGTQLEQVNEESICFRKRVASWPIAYEHTNRAQFYQQLGKCTLKTSDVQMDPRHMQIRFHPHCWKSAPLSPSPWTRPPSLTPEKLSVPEQKSYPSTALREAYQRSW